jgi:hypothetical protein
MFYTKFVLVIARKKAHLYIVCKGAQTLFHSTSLPHFTKVLFNSITVNFPRDITPDLGIQNAKRRIACANLESFQLLLSSL